MLKLDTFYYLCKTPEAIKQYLFRLNVHGIPVITPPNFDKEYVFCFRNDTKCVDYISYEGYKRYLEHLPHKLIVFEERKELV